MDQSAYLVFDWSKRCDGREKAGESAANPLKRPADFMAQNRNRVKFVTPKRQLSNSGSFRRLFHTMIISWIASLLSSKVEVSLKERKWFVLDKFSHGISHELSGRMIKKTFW